MNVAIIAAAGQGSRIGGERAKQFLELGGIPVIIHTLRRFEACAAIDETIPVLPAEETAGFLSLANGFGLRKVSRVVAGSKRRAESVRRGLDIVPEGTEIVAVHDGVRPFVTPDEIARTVASARAGGAAVLVGPVTDTIKEIDGVRIVGTPPRAKLRRALTPQCFRYDILKQAYEHLNRFAEEITDDSTLVEKLGVPITLVDGDPRNIKITRPEDFVLAEALLKQWSVASGQWSVVGCRVAKKGPKGPKTNWPLTTSH